MINRTNVVTALANLMLVALFSLPGTVGAIGAVAQTTELRDGSVLTEEVMPNAELALPAECGIAAGLQMHAASSEVPKGPRAKLMLLDCPLYVSMELLNPDKHEGLVDECNAEHGTDNCIVAGVCRLTDQYERSFTIGPFGTSWTVCRYDGCMGVLDDPLTAVEATFMSAVGPNQ